MMSFKKTKESTMKKLIIDARAEEIINDVSELHASYFHQNYTPPTNYSCLAARMSDDNKVGSTSLLVQQESGIRYAKEEDLEICMLESYVESAKDHEERKIFKEIIQKILKSRKSNKPIYHLILSYNSRGSRNKTSTNVLRDLMLTHGIRLHYSEDEFYIDRGSPQEVWDRWEKQSASSEEENQARRKITIGGRNKKIALGFPQQNPPFGYRAILVDKETKGYAFDPPFSSYMKRAFELAASGNEKFKKQLDKEFKGIIAGDIIPHRTRLINLLRSPFYYGDFQVKGRVFHSHSRILPPLVDKALWNQVQRSLDRRSRDTRSNKLNLPYTGTIKCGGDILDENNNPTGEICSGSFSGEQKRGKDITWGCGCGRKNCSQRKAKYMKKKGSQRYFSDEKIEEMLLSVVGKYQFSEEIIDWFKKKVESTVLEESDFKKSKVAAIQANISKKENTLLNIERERLEGGKLSPNHFEIRNQINAEIGELRKELKKQESVKVKADWIQEAIIKKMINLEQTFQESSQSTKAQIVKSFCNNVVLRCGQMNPNLKSFMKK